GLSQALGGLGILRFIGRNAPLKSQLGTLALGRQPDGLQALWGLRLEVCGPFVEPVGRLMHPTPLAAARAIHLAQRVPSPQRTIPNSPGWSVLQAATCEVQAEGLPGLRALP